MRGRTTCFRALLGVALAAGLAAAEARAQEAEPREMVLRSYEPSVPDAILRPVSPFELRGLADVAFGGIRNRGNHINRLINDGTNNYTQGNPAGILIAGTPRGTITPYFLADFFAAAPRTDWLQAQATIPSLANALGGGWNTAWNENTGFFARTRQWRPSDDQLGTVHSGVASTEDGTCTEHRNLGDGNILMAINDCPPTWGSEQFAGATKITTFQQWEEYFNTLDPNSFTWDTWRVPAEFVSGDLLGDAQSYYAFIDWAADRLVDFGNVVPDGVGAPDETGWPMGITVKVDVFSFSLPSVVDAAIYQMLIINDSEKVYGVGIDYDSLYVGNGHGVLFQNQSAAHYWRPELGALLLHNNGLNPGCNGANQAGEIRDCTFPNGQNNGGTAQIFLKTPIGDLRNKLFSNPGSPFFAPGHPLAGDTITFNHGRRCSFGACYGPVMNFTERSEFGFMASQEQLVLDGRTVSNFDAAAGWHDVFSNIDFPTLSAKFNTFLPPEGWDYNKDGVPDTLRLNSCHTLGCAEINSDTLPGGQNNGAGNLTGMTMAGPFALAAGDTTAMTLAFVSGTTPAQMVRNVENVISFYLNGYLGPKPPPAPTIVAVNTQPGDRDPGDDVPPPARVTIFIDDAVEEFEDPFLTNLRLTLEGSQLAADNPGLLEELDARIVDNVDRILVYKSCDIGTSFTSDADCDGDPLVDDTGTPIDGGWLSYAVIEQEDDGSFDNIFVDEDVTPGVTYIYSFVAVSKGFEPLVIDRDEDGNPFARILSDLGAPSLRNPLSASASDPNVVSVYVPASRQTGGQDARVVFSLEDPFFVSSFNPVTVTITGSIDEGGTFTAIFGDSTVVRQEEPETGGVTTTVEVFRTVPAVDSLDMVGDSVLAVQTFTTTNPSGVDVAGGTTVVTEFADTTVMNDDTTIVTTVVTTTTFAKDSAGADPVLSLTVLNSANEPLFVSSRLTGSGTTPGSFLGRPDFPLFLLDVNAGSAGDFISDDWLQARADSLAVLVAAGSPEVDWLEGSSSSEATLLGEYRLDWQDADFGPQGTFVPNLADPSVTEAEVAASLEARAVAQTTSTSQEVADVLVGGDQSALLAVDLPFTVTNATTGEQVIVAMTSKLETTAIGTNENTIDISVPADKWIPGDQMIFLERRDVARTDTTAGGAEYVVLTGGQPDIAVDSLIVTFDPAVVGCTTPRPSCSPVPAGAIGAQTGGHLPVRAGQILRVRYGSEVSATTTFAFDIIPTLRGDQITELTSEDVDLIRVVPNPYVVFSEYEQERDSEVSKLMFTSLPPEGQISIFTVSGQLIQRITYDASQLAGNGDLFWDMRTLENTDVAAGLYLFLVEGATGRDELGTLTGPRVKKLGKFVIIR